MSGPFGWISVEDAADRVAVSVATMRRWAATGTVDAKKAGKNWVVNPATLGRKSVPSTQEIAGVAGVRLSASWTHLTELDLRNPWVPDVLNFRDHVAEPASIYAAAVQKLTEAGPFDPALVVDVPKTSLLTRNGCLLSIEDRLAYQAAIDSIAKRIDRELSANVYSARLEGPQTDRFFKSPTDQWVRWHSAVLKALQENNAWLVRTDLVAYYDTIHHQALFSDIDSMNPDPMVATALKSMIKRWTNERDVGIPQGPEASAVLANLYLLPVDRVMDDGDWQYFRYMDDIRIVAPTRNRAMEALRLFERETRRRGLILSSTKTHVQDTAEAVKSIVDRKLDAAAYLWQSRRIEEVQVMLRALVEETLEREGEPDARRLRFSLYRLRALRDRKAVREVLSNLERLSLLAKQVLEYLREWLPNPAVIDYLDGYLNDPNRNASAYMASWLIAGLIDLNQPPSDSLSRYCRRTMRDRNLPYYLRTLAANLFALSRSPSDLVFIKTELHSEFDPNMIRGYLVALARVGALNRSVTRGLVARAPELQRTLNYLEGRAKLPYLVYAAPGPKSKAPTATK